MCVQVPIRFMLGSIKLCLAEMSSAKFIPKSDATFVESVRTWQVMPSIQTSGSLLERERKSFISTYKGMMVESFLKRMTT